MASLATVAHAGERSLTVLLAGGIEDSQIEIGLSSDGRTYVIDSIVSLEVGGDVCWHPTGLENELLCEAAAIAGFEVNAGAGVDSVSVDVNVQIPVTLRGGPGDDKLVGGGGRGQAHGRHWQRPPDRSRRRRLALRRFRGRPVGRRSR